MNRYWISVTSSEMSIDRVIRAPSLKVANNRAKVTYPKKFGWKIKKVMRLR